MARADFRRFYDFCRGEDALLTGFIAGLLSGIIGSMGLGGGTVLLIYLAAFMGVEQLRAQGINLIFFLPVGLLSVIIYSLKRQIKWKSVLIFAASGLVGAALGTFLSGFVGSHYTRLAFGILLILLGVNAVFTKKKTSE